MVFENSQDREECYYVGEDENGVREKQVSYEPIQKVPNSGTIVIAKEDHTVANLLRHQLLSQERVRFAAYQMPHPLVHRVLIRVEVGCLGPAPVVCFWPRLSLRLCPAGHRTAHNKTPSLTMGARVMCRSSPIVLFQTSDASYTPLAAVDRAFDSLITEFSQIDQRFKDEVEKKKSDRGDVFE